MIAMAVLASCNIARRWHIRVRVLSSLRLASPAPPMSGGAPLLTHKRRCQAGCTEPGLHHSMRRRQRCRFMGRAAAPSAADLEAACGISGEVCSICCSLLDVPGALAEEVSEVLLAYGAQSVAVEEFRPEGAPEQAIFAGQQDEGRVWERCTVLAYFPPEVDAPSLLASTAADFGLSHCLQLAAPVRTQDWEQSIKDSYQAAQVAPGLWIVPVWSQPPQQRQPGDTHILLEPGLAFGTGDHPTTRLCLRWLHSMGSSGQLDGVRCMDYGTGSGVLAVAALLMGAHSAVGTDIDALAVRAAQSNAALNHVEQRLAAYQCAADVGAQEPLAQAGLPSEQRIFDLTFANILQGPLVALAPRLAAYTKPGGLLGLSGILEEQAAAVVEAYSPWFGEFSMQAEERWALLTATRKQEP